MKKIKNNKIIALKLNNEWNINWTINYLDVLVSFDFEKMIAIDLVEKMKMWPISKSISKKHSTKASFQFGWYRFSNFIFLCCKISKKKNFNWYGFATKYRREKWFMLVMFVFMFRIREYFSFPLILHKFDFHSFLHHPFHYYYSIIILLFIDIIIIFHFKLFQIFLFWDYFHYFHYFQTKRNERKFKQTWTWFRIIDLGTRNARDQSWNRDI